MNERVNMKEREREYFDGDNLVWEPRLSRLAEEAKHRLGAHPGHARHAFRLVRAAHSTRSHHTAYQEIRSEKRTAEDSE